MQTELLVHVEGEAGEAALDRAASLLRAGRLVAFPTETVYGLGALALDPAAVRSIFAAKGRPSFNPLIVHVASVEEARALVSSWPQAAERLAAAFWPGPLTFVLPRAPAIPDEVCAGLPAVAIRMPSHPLARALLRRVGAPLAAPSANRYMAISPTRAEHVKKSLGGRIDAILDGGSTPVGIESTVVDLGGEIPLLLRPGAISREELERVVGVVHVASDGVEEGSARASPGLSKRHYAPDAKVRLVVPPWPPVEGNVGVIARGARPPSHASAEWLQLPGDPAGYARQLYFALHAMEDAGVEEIWIEAPPSEPSWEGVRNRLERAAAEGA